MTRRLWTDPRDHRTWEITACSPRVVGDSAPGGGTDRRVRCLCFATTATPRRGHAVPCCPRVESFLDRLDDQALALCLDGARAGGFLWLDDRDGEVWWLGPEAGGARRGRSRAREVSFRSPAAPPEAMDDEALRALVGAAALAGDAARPGAG